MINERGTPTYTVLDVIFFATRVTKQKSRECKACHHKVGHKVGHKVIPAAFPSSWRILTSKLVDKVINLLVVMLGQEKLEDLSLVVHV